MGFWGLWGSELGDGAGVLPEGRFSAQEEKKAPAPAIAYLHTIQHTHGTHLEPTRAAHG
eukprot:COSAG01_NODE_53369_length_331_cov_3.204167_1_plen_58_part_10